VKFKINAGAEVDVLSQGELREELKAQTDALTGGCQYRWISQQSGPPAALLSFTFQPRDGLLWDVQIISVKKDGAGVVRVALVEDQPSGFIAHVADDTNNGNTFIPSRALIVPSGTPLLVITPTYLGIGACRILVKEVRATEQWRL
jgi:hypothetical protein